MKRLVERVERVNEKFGRKITATYQNKKLFWKEVKREMEGEKSDTHICKIKMSEGVFVKNGEEKVWKRHFESVMKESVRRRSEMTSMSVQIN